MILKSKMANMYKGSLRSYTEAVKSGRLDYNNQTRRLAILKSEERAQLSPPSPAYRDIIIEQPNSRLPLNQSQELMCGGSRGETAISTLLRYCIAFPIFCSASTYNMSS